MKRQLFLIASSGLCSSMYAGKVETIQKGLYVITKNNPGLASNFVGYMVGNFIILIIISIISGIVSIILYSAAQEFARKPSA